MTFETLCKFKLTVKELVTENKKRWRGFTLSRVLFLALVTTISLRFDDHSSRRLITQTLKRSDPEVSSEPLLKL